MSVTGLRFFTVYGPWGRPDMAAFKFAQNIVMERNITIFQVNPDETSVFIPSTSIETLRSLCAAQPVSSITLPLAGLRLSTHGHSSLQPALPVREHPCLVAVATAHSSVTRLYVVTQSPSPGHKCIPCSERACA